MNLPVLNDMICRLCGSSRLFFYYAQGSSRQFKYYKCENCSLVNIDLDTVNITENQSKYELSFPEPYSREKNKGSFDTWEFIENNIPAKGKMLDIGCGSGALLLLAKKAGWRVKGLELSEHLARKIRNELGIEVDNANFLELSKTNEKYDLAALRHVLEHLPDSVKAMSKINMMLGKGGKAVLEFPNIEALSFKFKRFLGKYGFYKKKYSDDYVPGHCNEFSRKSFIYLCKKTGFRLIKWETYSSKPAMNYVYKVFPVGTKARALIAKK